MEKESISIAVLRKTPSLENDDRLRKEYASLMKLYPGIKVKAFVMLKDNREYESVTSYGLPFRSVGLKSRDELSHGSHLIKKSWDYYQAIQNDLKAYDIVWNSGDEPTPALLFIHHKTLFWDLRELPMFLLGSRWKRMVLKHLFNKCTVMIHANQYRIDYLKRRGLIKDEKKHLVVRNFPEFSTVDPEYDARYHEVKEWIGNRTCVYLQGLSNESRAAYESLSAILRVPGLCAIVLGTVSDSARKRVTDEYGEKTIEERICFAGNFKVLKVPQYLALCHLSLVFYKNTTPNNYYCEANRLYQAIDAGLPVVVGSNPSMKGIVEELGVGLSVDTDGSDVPLIEHGIRLLLDKRDSFVDNIKHLHGEIKWESQEPSLKQAVDILIKHTQKKNG